jgi:hypothetical protein
VAPRAEASSAAVLLALVEPIEVEKIVILSVKGSGWSDCRPARGLCRPTAEFGWLTNRQQIAILVEKPIFGDNKPPE